MEQCAREFFLLEINACQHFMCQVIPGIDLRRLQKSRFGFFQGASFHIGQSQIEQCRKISRVSFQRPFVRADGFFMLF
jgi:hypothetical protein